MAEVVIFVFLLTFIPNPGSSVTRERLAVELGHVCSVVRRERGPSQDNLEIGEFLGARRHGDNSNIYCEFCLFMLLTLTFM